MRQLEGSLINNNNNYSYYYFSILFGSQAEEGSDDPPSSLRDARDPHPCDAPLPGGGVGTAASRVGVGCEWGGPGFWVGKVCVGVNPTGGDTITPPPSPSGCTDTDTPRSIFPDRPPPPP